MCDMERMCAGLRWFKALQQGDKVRFAGHLAREGTLFFLFLIRLAAPVRWSL